MNEQADKAFLAADAELNRFYASVQKAYADDPLFLRKLRDSQRLWVKFRDAEMAVMYPHQDDPRYYGSMLPMCLAMYRRDLTTARTATLKSWMAGTEEGDACAGSVKTPSELKASIGEKKP